MRVHVYPSVAAQLQNIVLQNAMLQNVCLGSSYGHNLCLILLVAAPE